jgi:hypothetical protein
VADTEVGLGGTSQWKLCGLDHDTTLAVMFEVVGAGGQGQEQGQVRRPRLLLVARRGVRGACMARPLAARAHTRLCCLRGR